MAACRLSASASPVGAAARQGCQLKPQILPNPGIIAAKALCVPARGVAARARDAARLAALCSGMSMQGSSALGQDAAAGNVSAEAESKDKLIVQSNPKEMCSDDERDLEGEKDDEAEHFARALRQWHVGSDAASATTATGAFSNVARNLLADEDSEVDQAGEVVDHAMPLELRFANAVEFVGTKLGGRLPELAQRQLYALSMLATRGPPPQQAPRDLHPEQWLAWASVREHSKESAMREYLGIVDKFANHGGDARFMSEPPVEKPFNELPEALRQQLEAAGIRPAMESIDAQGEVFAATRAFDRLDRFLPAQCNEVDEDGLSALHHAVDAEQLSSAAVLLAAKADVNARDPTGATPLHFAAMLGADDIARLLLTHGADATRLDGSGASAADNARAEGHTALAETLAATKE